MYIHTMLRMDRSRITLGLVFLTCVALSHTVAGVTDEVTEYLTIINKNPSIDFKEGIKYDTGPHNATVIQINPIGQGIETVTSNATTKPPITTPTLHTTTKTANDDIKPKEANEQLEISYLAGKEHPCFRPCVVGQSMICHYQFNLEWYQTMSKACYNCPYNYTDCFRPDCIPGDGMSRSVTVVNRKMPGPSVEVCQGDRIIVDVENHLMAEGSTIHWHGHQQRGTPYMDGAPFVTQCPIQSSATFRYQFNASHPGTHFWHSHTGMQRADGAFGAFIVRKPKSHERHIARYDYDRSEHVMVILDWTHNVGVSIFTKHHHSNGDNKPPSLLVNGLGKFLKFNNTATAARGDDELYMRAARFDVEQGYRYRFRVINAEFLNCPIEMSIDNHTLLILSSDGNDIQPVEADSLVTYAGERFDFVVKADQDIDNYWIRFRGLMDCDERFTKARQVAVLHYEGALETEPDHWPTWEESHKHGLQVNALNRGEEDNTTLSIPKLTSVDPDDISLKPKADLQLYISYDFYAKDNAHFHRANQYGFYQVQDKKARLYTPQLNHISMKLPSTPLLLSKGRTSKKNFCDKKLVMDSATIDNNNECVDKYCECTHLIEVPLGSVVELVLIDEGYTFDANHPFHLHGHAFRVVAMERISNVTSTAEVRRRDAAGLIKRKLKGAPLKDTVTVPDGGYTIVRWLADNPGYWLFHCHIEFHVEIGMAIVFKVGDTADMPPTPPGFPQCGDWVPEDGIEDLPQNIPATAEGSPVISITNWWPVVYVNGTSSAGSYSLCTYLNILLAISLLFLMLTNFIVK